MDGDENLLSLSPEDVLLFAADSARVMLESGGETYRAEDVAVAVASALGGAEAECYATPTGVTVSFVGIDGRVHTIVRRIKRRAMHLERVALVNALARDLASGKLCYASASAELDRIERLPGRGVAASSAAAGVGAAFFTLLFGGRWNDAIAAALAGALVSRFPSAMARRQIPDFFTNIVAGAVATFVCLAAWGLGLATNADAAVIGVLMLLVPGVAVTNAIRDTIAGDLVAGVARGADAFMSAAGISVGAGGAYLLWQLLSGGSPSGEPINAVIGSAVEVAQQSAWAGLATAGFAVLFNLRGRDLPLTAACGALGWAVAAPIQAYSGSQPLAYLAASAAIGLAAEAIAVARKRPASVYIYCGILPLVPGGGMYYTMLEYLRGEGSRSLSIGFATLLLAGAIAAGLAISSAASRLLSLRGIAKRISLKNTRVMHHGGSESRISEPASRRARRGKKG